MGRVGEPRRGGWLIAPALLVLCGVLGSAVGVLSEEPKPVGAPDPSSGPRPGGTSSPEKAEKKIVFPPEKAVILSGSFDVVAKGNPAPVSVNGLAVECEAFRSPLRVARVHLSAGMNTIQVGDRKCRLYFARYPDDEDAPRGWPAVKWHPIDEQEGAGRCAECHETKKLDGLVSVGDFLGYKACLKCHKEVEFEAIHAHPLEPLEPCQMCHGIHGSTEKGLLKAPVKKLCAECHES